MKRLRRNAHAAIKIKILFILFAIFEVEIMELETLKQKIREKKAYYRNNYSVKEIGIFGSVLRGESTSESDLDILVEFEKPVDLFQFIELEEDLSHITGSKVDLVSKKSLKPFIGKRILEEVSYL